MKKLCLHNISIHTNFHQNQSIFNESARMILALKWSYMTLADLWGHTLFYEKFVSWKAFKRSSVKQITQI